MKVCHSSSAYAYYRKLNSLLLAVTPTTGTKKGAFALMPLLKIDELFALLKGTKYFTALDLHSGYYQIKLDEKSIPKSAFTTVFGKFDFLSLPFGLIYDLFGLDRTSPQGQGSGYLAFLDNILIHSRKEKEHLQISISRE